MLLAVRQIMAVSVLIVEFFFIIVLMMVCAYDTIYVISVVAYVISVVGYVISVTRMCSF